MPSPANAINQTASGIVKFDGVSTFSSTALTPYCVLVGDTSNNIASIGPGTAGQALQAKGVSANPAFTTATYPSTATGTGNLLIANGTNWVASTPTYPNSASTAGKVVISDGTNFVTSTPTFPNASATTRKIIVSDGTNWVASTETYAAPSTSANVLTSDGTNWVSSVPTAEVSLTTFTTTITNAQLKAGTPITLISAGGAGTIIYVTSANFKLNYGGNNAFSNTPTAGISYSTTTTNALITIGASFWTATSNYYSIPSPYNAVSLAADASALENAAISWVMSAASTGNAANDNTVTVEIKYLTLTL